ncbi:outer surface protein [Neobacillus sp. WH10]|uniref:outer surface protein n=1 Tax=Neobacillus sp. WH10 TaxID=3047873 RepID=UPI0024C0F873|nr:outer surface protein [Neobacillus sp. WH10]WHY77304.1 outer surface protein [Neobacillus sp. WH10]
MIKRKNILIFFLITLLVGIFFYFSLGKESKIKEFPVPLLAKYIEDENSKDFKYSSTGILYSLTLWFNGWKKVAHEGDSTVFKKNDREVIVVKHTGENFIYIFEDE